MLNIPSSCSMDAGEVFSGSASGKLVTGFSTACEYTPQTDFNYSFNGISRDVVVWFMMSQPEPLYVYGPCGSGKSSLIRQLASRLNYPVFEVNGHERLEVSDLIGHLTVNNGNMQFEDGALTLAMRYGGLFLFNEIDLCSPATLAGLNTILDGSPLCITENNGEIVTPAPTFRFVATANTNGGSDETGLYQGTLRQNLAFLDRFMLVEVNYPEADIEKDLLKKLYPQLPDDVIDGMVKFANEVRKLFCGDYDDSSDMQNKLDTSCEVTLSTRTLLRWADLTVRFHPLVYQGIQPISYAFDRALGFRASRITRSMLHELLQRIFPSIS